jgi:hypothetical protein
VAINTWVHIGLSRDSSNNVYIWKDGASYLAGNVTGPITNFDKEFGIGCQVNTSNSQWFTGRIDEVRLSKAARSSGWSETEVANQNNPSAFIKSFGTEETYTAINFYPIIQYNEDNEMFQIAGTSKAHPVQIRSLTSGDLLPPEQQTNPVFTVYVNGTLSEETVTMSAFNATMLRNLITVPDTLAVNAYDSVEINVSCDNDGSGFMMVNIVPDPATTGTTAQQVWEYSGTRALTTAPPTASAISDYIWTAASSRTLTAVPTGVALEATLTDMKGSGFAATDSLKDIKASLSSVTVDITGLATTTNITDAVAAIRGAAGTETLDTIAADIAAISVTGGSSAEQIIPATYITLGAAEKTITLASPYNTISKEQVLFIQDLNTGDIIYNSKFPRVNPITVEGGVITYTHPSEEIVSSPTSDIIQICVNKV